MDASPTPSPVVTDAADASQEDLDTLLDRINVLSGGGSPASTGSTAPEEEKPNVDSSGAFYPQEPSTFYEAGISSSLVEELVVKYLLAVGEASIRQIADQVCLPFVLIEELITSLKSEQVLGYIDQSPVDGYVCKLTEVGRDRGRSYHSFSSYYGSAPVAFRDYCESVEAQTINDQNPTREDLDRAFHDLLIDPDMMIRLGPAVNSGRGMFLFGYPGNGKTSIAERITAAFGPYVWIPRAITMDRDIVRIFDPMSHEEVPLERGEGIMAAEDFDRRWVRIKRPTIVVGGELTMDHLEIQYNPATGISEAPVQMKSNTGLLLIDDFGRQRMSVDELLNRWIVPLEKRYDFLNTSNGKKIQVPFDQLVVFSTNLEPKDLVDDAFLRRIPYKIEVPNPSIENFVKLFQIMCKIYKFEWRPELIQGLLTKHYLPTNRPLRNCHPRDLLLQVQNYCKYLGQPIVLSEEALDFACENYFSIM